MTKQEFLDELKEALSREVSPESMMDSYRYYAAYIEDAVNAGKNEEQVIEELGSPLLIARSIIAAQTGERTADVEYTEDGRTKKVRNKNTAFQSNKSEKKEFHVNTGVWFARVLSVLLLILLIVIVFSLLSGFLWVVIHFAIPVLIILGIIYLIMYALK